MGLSEMRTALLKFMSCNRDNRPPPTDLTGMLLNLCLPLFAVEIGVNAVNVQHNSIIEVK